MPSRLAPTGLLFHGISSYFAFLLLDIDSSFVLVYAYDKEKGQSDRVAKWRNLAALPPCNIGVDDDF